MSDKNAASQSSSSEPDATEAQPDKAVATDNGVQPEKATKGVEDDNQVDYDELRDENRLVMRHNIALNIDNFRASSDDFELHPKQDFPELKAAQPPFVSIIVPNHNGQRFIDTLFGSLQQQTFQDFEVIFVDDASTDNSIDDLERRFDAHLANTIPRDLLETIGEPQFILRIIANRTNQGFVASCNKGASIARGRVLVMLNNDTEPEKSWLEELVKVVCSNPDAAIITSKMLLFDQRDRLHTTGDMLGRDGIPYNRGVWQEDQGQFDDQLSVFSGSGGGSAYRRDVWDSLGGFDEDFWMYLEDVDYGFRAQLAGWEVKFAPEARIYHHLSATSGHTLASYQVGRNTIWTVAKNMPRGLLIRNLPSIIWAQLIISIDALRNIRGEAAQARIKGQLASLIGLPRQLRKRQIIQQRRILDDRALEEKLG